MDITDLEGLKYLENLQSRMEKMIKDIRSTGSKSLFCERVWKPLVDIYETTESIIVLVEIAGIKKEDLSIVFNKDTLVIAGKRENPAAQCAPQQKMHQVEIDFGYFERVIKLAIPIEGEKIAASYKDGFLWVHLPKLRKPVTQKIEILTE